MQITKVEKDLGEMTTKMVSLSDVRPNPWNPNEMDERVFFQLRENIMEFWERYGNTPPIIVRETPSGDTHSYEIIDGEHRFRCYSDPDFIEMRGSDEIPVYVWNLNDVDAKLMTSALNYNKGEPDPDRYADMLTAIHQESGMTADEISNYLHVDSDYVASMIGDIDFDFGELPPIDPELLQGETIQRSERTPDEKVDLVYSVSPETAMLIEGELNRRLHNMVAPIDQDPLESALKLIFTESSEKELDGEDGL